MKALKVRHVDLKVRAANQKNVAEEMEDALGTLFTKWLESNGYDNVVIVLLTNGEVIKKRSGASSVGQCLQCL